jgi:hypothetical protein
MFFSVSRIYHWTTKWFAFLPFLSLRRAVALLLPLVSLGVIPDTSVPSLPFSPFSFLFPCFAQ